MREININGKKLQRIISESVKKLLSEGINSPQELISLLGGSTTKATFNIVNILNFLKKNGVIDGFNSGKLGNLICGQQQAGQEDDDSFSEYDEYDDPFEDEGLDDFGPTRRR